MAGFELQGPVRHLSLPCLPPNKKPFRERYLNWQSQRSPFPAYVSENVPRREGKGDSHCELLLPPAPTPPIVMTRQGITLDRLTINGLGHLLLGMPLHSEWKEIKTSPLHPWSPTLWQYFCHRNTWLSAPVKQPWTGAVVCCQNEKWFRAKGLGAAMLTVKEP